jgi:hypothetical protein
MNTKIRQSGNQAESPRKNRKEREERYENPTPAEERTEVHLPTTH